jgi:DNA-binding CsgD family transcriptional regulator
MQDLDSKRVQDRAPAGVPEDRVVARFELDGQVCRLMNVNGVVPHHATSANSPRIRVSYADNEIAHFEFQGSRFAVVREEPEVAGPPDVEPEGGAPRTGGIWDLLTTRELQIVQLICMGYLAKQVAQRLNISEFTVRSYLKTVYAKLGVRSRGAMVFKYAQAFAGNRTL